MRRLLLLRHAKTERSEPGGRDHERKLDSRGRSDTPKIGAYMARHGYLPQRALVSSAVRTQETWALLAKAFRPTPAMVSERRLYDAGAQSILKVIKETPDQAATLLVVGHNPGLHELAIILVASGDIEARERLREKMPTCALAVIDFALDGWDKLHVQSGRLERFITPKLLETATD
ncbi:MAG TPA: histidine phosphatase family protein [Pseudolabrys sp.]|nr:histidine phosphatase family protein [Pseudolabrys sp.]